MKPGISLITMPIRMYSLFWFIDGIIMWRCSENILYYFGVWGTMHRYWRQIYKLLSQAVSWRSSYERVPENQVRVFTAQPNPISQTHSQLTTLRALQSHLNSLYNPRPSNNTKGFRVSNTVPC
jgi:hypothetical protein